MPEAEFGIDAVDFPATCSFDAESVIGVAPLSSTGNCGVCVSPIRPEFRACVFAGEGFLQAPSQVFAKFDPIRFDTGDKTPACYLHAEDHELNLTTSCNWRTDLGAPLIQPAGASNSVEDDTLVGFHGTQPYLQLDFLNDPSGVMFQLTERWFRAVVAFGGQTTLTPRVAVYSWRRAVGFDPGHFEGLNTQEALTKLRDDTPMPGVYNDRIDGNNDGGTTVCGNPISIWVTGQAYGPGGPFPTVTDRQSNVVRIWT